MATDPPARPNARRRYLLPCLALVLLGVACGTWLRPPQVVREALAEPFTTERWAGASLDSPARYRMLPRLLRDHRLVGMTPAEAESLLGPPTERDIGPQGWGWFVYYLGHDDDFFDSWRWRHLILRFEDGRVKTVEQMTTWVGENQKPVIRQN